MDFGLIWLLGVTIEFVHNFQQLLQDPKIFLRIVDLECARCLATPREQVTQHRCLTRRGPFYQRLSSRPGHIDLSSAATWTTWPTSSGSHFHAHAHATTFFEISGPFGVNNGGYLWQCVTDVVGILSSQRRRKFVLIFSREIHVMLDGQLDDSIFHELVEKLLIERILGPNENIFLSIVEFFPGLQDLIPPLADQRLHFLMGQFIRQLRELTLDRIHASDFALDSRCLLLILLLQSGGTHVPDSEGGE